ncbi:MAG: AMP-binding protein [Ramlibacter sp.]|nr:AMP-binding protein [Cryobacterium sp.]
MTAGTESSTHWPTIRKDVHNLPVTPNLLDYEQTRAGFAWDEARRGLSGLPGGQGLNIAYEAVDRHAAGPRAHKDALRFIRPDGTSHSLTYADLLEQTSRFASVLRGLGIERGDRVFPLTGRIPELYVAVLGTLRHAGVFCPPFSAFGPEPVRQRLQLGGGRALITTRALYRKKVAPIRAQLPNLQHVLLVDAAGEPEPGTLDLAALMRAAPPYGEIAETHPQDMALLHFTSGTTGTPKGAIHAHDAVTTHFATGRFALDLHPEDTYWCTADPGWVTGTSYGVIAPLVHGVTCIVDEEEMDADRWYRILAEQRVTVWYTAPTALRMLMKAGAERAAAHDLSALRFVASVGEPLNNFSLLALDQIMNNAATLRHMSGGQFSVPLVIRMTTGAGRQLAAQHSHSLEGWYAHIPGLRILTPSTLADARGMLWTALQDPDPVLIFEHGSLYNVAGEIDDDAILATVARTHLAVIVDEGWRSGSISSELSARITESAFFDLDAPVGRVCSAEVPLPYAKHLELAAFPSLERVVAAAREAVGAHG